MASQVPDAIVLDYDDEVKNSTSSSLPQVDHPSLPPLVHSLSMTNDPPSEEEMTSLRDMLASAEESSRRLVHQTDLLRLDGVDVPDELYHQADVAKVYLQDLKIALRGILSPVRRVPAEVIAEIVVFAVAAVADRDPYYVSLDTQGPAWLLAQVCSTWRTVVLTLPTLWSTVHIDMPASTNLRYPEVIAAELLRRSGDLPLSLEFKALEPTDDAGLKVLGVIIAHCHRWEYLSLFRLHATYLPMFAQVKERLPILRSLFLSSDDSAAPPDFILDAFEVAPLLETLHLFCRSVPAHAMLFPWSQLGEYGTDCSDLQPYYHNFIKVEKFIFLGRDPLVVSTHIPIRLPLLEELHMNNSAILDYLDLPALKHLDTMECQESVARCVNRSAAPLEELVLRGDLSVLDVLGQSLSQMPTITSLSLDSTVFIPGIIPLLTHDSHANGMPTILPNLRHLHIEMDVGEGDVVAELLDDNAVVRLVESRWTMPADYEESMNGFTRIKSFCFFVNGKHEFTQEALARLKDMEEEGLDLHIALDHDDDTDTDGDSSHHSS